MFNIIHYFSIFVLIFAILHVFIFSPIDDDAEELFDLFSSQRCNNDNNNKEKKISELYDDSSCDPNSYSIIVAGAWRAPPTNHDNNLKSIPLFVPDLASDHTYSEAETLTKPFRLRIDRAVEIALSFKIPRIVFTGALDDAIISRQYVLEKYLDSRRNHDVPLDDELLKQNQNVESSLRMKVMKLFVNPRTDEKTGRFFPGVIGEVELIVEIKSRTTEENAKFALEYLSNNDKNEKTTTKNIIVVTNPAHLRRSAIYFKREFYERNEHFRNDNKNKNNNKKRVFLIKSSRNTFEFRYPRGIFVPVTSSHHKFAELLKTNKSRGFQKIFLFLKTTLNCPQFVLDAAVVLFWSWKHLEYRIVPTINSVPMLFEFKEFCALYVNVMFQGKLSWSDVKKYG